MLCSEAVLIVEDEALIAIDIEAEMLDRGWRALSPVGTLDAAHRMLDDVTPSLALLDINVGGTTSFALADRLSDRNVPVIFLTGNRSESLPGRWQQAPLMGKPIDFNQLAVMINKEINATAAHSAAGDQRMRGAAQA